MDYIVLDKDGHLLAQVSLVSAIIITVFISFDSQLIPHKNRNDYLLD